MSGSDAEERIRAKVEAELRAEFPDARIVHELNTQHGGVRLDLAAVRQDGLTLIEIKSERDVLKRLRSQVSAALRITGDCRIYAADKHARAIADAGHNWLRGEDGCFILDWSEDERRGAYRPNPSYIAELSRVQVRVETPEGFRDLTAMHGSWWPRVRREHIADVRAQLEMLWAAELTAMLGQGGIHCPPRANRSAMKRLALEDMTGRQIRLAVCAALRARPFARADEPRIAA